MKEENRQTVTPDVVGASQIHDGETATTPVRAPVIWYIVGDRLGDNAQVETLVAGLDLPIQRKYVCVKAPWIKGKPKVVPSLHHLDLEKTDLLEGPWPDLIITVGRRLSMVALWIQQQSGGRTRLVLIGKPSGQAKSFSLFITSAEVQMPPAPDLLKISMPLLRVDESRVRAAAEQWRDRLANLPRPLIGILVGGPTNPFVFNRRVENGLIQSALDVVKNSGGTPYITTSPRTPERTIRVLRERLPEQARFFEWQAGAEDNPYHALLGLADGFVVTGDSISMLVEVAKLRRPLAIFSLPYGLLHKIDQLRRVGARWLYEPDTGARSDVLRKWLRRIGGALHILPRTRDFTAIHKLLIDRGLAVPAGTPLRPPEGEVPNDLPLVAERIDRLIAELPPGD
ncbi:MAG: mitochondrial fission ELM1 family protein [Gammaproteobacteria bacterium]